jgi:hypothetical protein
MYDGLMQGCILHDKGLKPIEGRLACHDRTTEEFKKEFQELKKKIVEAWDTRSAKALIEIWEAEFYG